MTFSLSPVLCTSPLESEKEPRDAGIEVLFHTHTNFRAQQDAQSHLLLQDLFHFELEEGNPETFKHRLVVAHSPSAFFKQSLGPLSLV